MIDTPLIEQCKANLECKLCMTQEIGSGFIIYGEIVSASIWDKLMKVERAKKYKLFDQTVFLENSLIGKFNKIETLDNILKRNNNTNNKLNK